VSWGGGLLFVSSLFAIEASVAQGETFFPVRIIGVKLHVYCLYDDMPSGSYD
jgi:hypothetical protein